MLRGTGQILRASASFARAYGVEEGAPIDCLPRRSAITRLRSLDFTVG